MSNFEQKKCQCVKDSLPSTAMIVQNGFFLINWSKISQSVVYSSFELEINFDTFLIQNSAL